MGKRKGQNSVLEFSTPREAATAPSEAIEDAPYWEAVIDTSDYDRGVVDGAANNFNEGYAEGFLDREEMYVLTQKMKQKNSKIRVTLNRPLTWAERETFRVAIEESAFSFDPVDEEPWETHRFTKNAAVFYIEAAPYADTRGMAWILHEWFSHALFNVHLVSVKTIYPEVRV